MRRGQAWLLCLLLMVAAAASAADQPGSKQDHAAKLKYDGDSYEGKDENEGYGYEKPYGCDDDDCPNPQVADSVRNGEQNWMELMWGLLSVCSQLRRACRIASSDNSVMMLRIIPVWLLSSVGA